MDRQSIINEIRKKYGQEALVSSDTKIDIDVISTGSFSLDDALGIDGIPRGRITEVWSENAVGKTLLALNIIKEAQKNGLLCAFIDAEHALSIESANRIGVDIDSLLISQPSSGEQALNIVEDLLKTKQIGLIVIDSVSALVPQAEIDGDMEANNIGLQARMMSKALRKINPLVHASNTALFFINQVRTNINITYGASPTTTSGGKALAFHSSVRIELKKSGQIKNSADEVVGHTVKARIVKNKLAMPFKIVEYDIMYDEGMSQSSDVFRIGLKNGLITKQGNTYSFGDTKLGVGEQKTRDYLKANENILNDIIGRIKKNK